MMPKRILTITLNPAVDKVIPLASFSSKEYDPRQEIVSAGGKGLNVSRALRCLGTRTLATGISGGRAGKLIKRILVHEGIPSDLLWIAEESRTNITLKDKPTQNRLRIMGIGPTIKRKTLKSFEARLRKRLKECSCVAICGRNAVGVPGSYYARLIRMAKRKRIVSVLDSGAPELAEGIMAKPDIIKPNIDEAESALGRKLVSVKQYKKAIKDFHNKGIPIVLLTLAERGAMGGFRGRIWNCRVPQVRISHEVGCGDAFLAGFLHAWSQGYNFPDALRFATSCGTINCRGVIPGKIDKREVLAMLENISVKEV